MASGIICWYIPFFIYGYGVANWSGRTEDLFTIAFATYQANVLTHHMQLFITIRNYTLFYFFTGLSAILFMWPIMIALSNYGIFSAETLGRHLGTIMIE